MRELRNDDTVRFEGQGKVHFGLVKSVGKRSAIVYDINTYETRKIALSRLTYVPPVILDPQQLTKLCRYEINWSDLTGGAPDIVRVIFSEPFTLTLKDLYAGLQNIRNSNDDNSKLYSEWFEPIYSHYCIYLEDFPEEKTPDDVVIIPGLPDRAKKVSGILGLIESIFNNSIPLKNAASGLIRDIDRYFEDERKPVCERTYKDQEKEDFLLYYDSSGGSGDLSSADDTTITLYRSFLNELSEKDNKLALKLQGKSCFYGDRLFERDTVEAYRLLNKLFELTADPHYAVYLGDLFYSGECADGIPHYEEAFRYYCIGSVSGSLRAMGRVARSFAFGQGVLKNTDIAWKIVEEIYAVCERRFLMGDYNCKLAEAAFYRGKCIQSGNFGCHSMNLAYESLLQARLAVKKRMEFGNKGDDVLLEEIQGAIDEMFNTGIIQKRNKSAKVWINSLLYHHLHKYRRMIMRVRRLKCGELKLTFSIEIFPDENEPPLMFITETDTGFCDTVSSVSVRVSDSTLENVPDEPIYFNSTDGHAFFLGGTKVITIDGDYIFTVK